MTKPSSNPRVLILKATLLSLSMLFAAAVAADCPDRSTKCNTATYGWQGQSLQGIFCKDIGPPHCPKQPMLKVAKSKALLEGAGAADCRKKLIAKKYKVNGPSACSIPSKVKKIFGMASLVFGKSACVEHDICYAMKGMNQKLCDTMFLDNMLRSCKTYYYGHLGNRKAIKLRNGPGYTSCKAAAKLFYTGVATVGGRSFNPSTSEEKLCKDDQGEFIKGPPKLATQLHLTTLGSKDRIKATSNKNSSDKPGKIKVCLRNKTKQWKGMHYKQADKAKYIAKRKDNTSCGHYWPGTKKFYFWEKYGMSSKKRVNGQPLTLDLSGYANYRINLDWYED